MALTQEQIDVAAKIADKVRRLYELGCDELDIFIELINDMPEFRQLMATAGPDGRDKLNRWFDGFLRYAEIVDVMDVAARTYRPEFVK